MSAARYMRCEMENNIREKVEQQLAAIKRRLDDCSSIIGGQVKEENNAFFDNYKAGAEMVLKMLEEK